MKSSLNEIAENIAYALGDQFNMTFREAIKHTVELVREKLLREEDFNVGLNYNDFRQTITMTLTDWQHPVCGRGRITTEELPDSIRFKNRGRVNYYYIGDNTFGKPYTQTTLVEYPFVSRLMHNINSVYYIIDNGKVIVLNEHKLCKLGVEAVFAQPQNAAKFCDNPELVLDDEPYPISGDLLAIIRQGMVSGIFPILPRGEEGVITSDSNDEQTKVKTK